jgi:integrase
MRLGEAGADAFTIMRLMGHSSVTISQRYVHSSPETAETAISRMEAISTKKFGLGIELGIPDHSAEAET